MVDREALERIGRELLIAIGEDPERDGLRETPARWAKFWVEFIDHEPGKIATAFEPEVQDEMIAVCGMQVWSLCEHHLLPFRAVISVAYIPKHKMLGLSKFARIAHKYAHQPQVQERLVSQIADEIERVTGSDDVAVIADGEHLCMTMRGVRTPAGMRTSVMRGAFRTNGTVRAEFLALALRGQLR